jgi:murein L,D-transpeptidase YafK
MGCTFPLGCFGIARRFGAFALLASTVLFLASCNEDSVGGASSRSNAPLAPDTLALMEQTGTTKNAPVLIRTYKKESELEIWKMKADGRYALLKTYPMCRWSGQLGPKTREGDRQVPEGFYAITPAQMNPNSAYYLSFNVGYPNAYDRALGRGGGSIMVHGICSSAGCFSMTDPQIGEIYAIAREGFSGGQREIQMQSYPFRMTAENLAKYRLDQNIDFWKQLKDGSDNFEVTQQEVAVGVCNKHYVFNAAPASGGHFDPAGPCPALKQDDEVRSLVAAKEKRDDVKIAELAGQVRPVRTVYVDGGQHPSFVSLLPFASRPEALARPPVDIALDEGKAKKSKTPPLVQMAAIKANPSSAEPGVKGDPADVTGAIADPAKPQSSLFGRFFGEKPVEQAPEPTIAVNEPLVPQFADVPLPPRRSEGAGVKPQAALPGSSTTAGPAAASTGSAKPQTAPAADKPLTGAMRDAPVGVSAVAQVEH